MTPSPNLLEVVVRDADLPVKNVGNSVNWMPSRSVLELKIAVREISLLLVRQSLGLG